MSNPFDSVARTRTCANGLRGCVAAMMIALVSACSDPADIDSLVREAQEYVAAGKLNEGVLQYKAAIGQNPERHDLRLALARVYLAGGDGPSAEKELRRAVRAGHMADDVPVLLTKAMLLQGDNQAIVDGEPLKTTGIDPGTEDAPLENAHLLALIGHAHFALRDYAAAEKNYESAAALDPSLDEALVGRASIALYKRDTESARALLEQAAQANPKSAIVWSNLAALEAYEGNPTAAEEAYSKAIASTVNNADHLFSRFLVRLERGEISAAKEDFNEFQQKTSRKHLIPYGKGLIAFHEKAFEAAATAFTDSLSIAPNYPAAIAYLGFSNYALKRYEQAFSQFQRVRTLTPGTLELTRALATTSMHLNDYKSAREYAEEILAVEPDDTEALTILSTAAMALGDQETGLKALKKVTASGTDSADSRAGFGLGLLSGGEFDAGFAEIKAASAEAPDNAMSYGILVFGQMQQGNAAEAIATAEKAIAQLPDNPLGNNLLGGIKLAQGDMAGAKTAFEAALAVFPGDPSASNNLAALALANGDTAAAREYYQGVLTVFPQHVRTHIKLSELDVADDKLAVARRRLQSVLDFKPDDPVTSLALARVQQREGKLADALATLQNVVAAHPQNIEIAASLAEMAVDSGDAERAIEVLNRAIDNHPNSALLFNLMGSARAAAGQLEGAENAYMAALGKGTRSAAVQVDTIRSLIELHSLDVATEALHVFKELHGETVEGTTLGGLLEMNKGNLDSAITEFERVVANHPEHREAVLLLARAESRSGKLDESATRLENWLEKYSDDTQARYQLANIYIAAGDKNDEAIAMYKRVVEDDPKHALALNNLAWLLRKSDPTAALGYAEKAAQEQPNSGMVLDTLGLLQAAKGDLQVALNTLQRALKATPSSNEIRLHLGRVQLQAGDTRAARASLQSIVDSGDANESVEEARALLARLSN